MAIELENVASGFSTGIINDNFRRLEEYINDNLLKRDGTETGEANQMELPLDMNSNPVLNASVDPDDPGSLLTREFADSLYVDKVLWDEGYVFAGEYAPTAGIVLERYNEVVRDPSGEMWRVATTTSLPYTTTGAGMPEGGAFVAVGDAALRQDLANPDKGAAMVAYMSRTQADRNADTISVRDYITTPVDGVTSNQEGIVAAVAAAYELGAELHWPAGTYVSADSIPNFHSIEHTGEGVVRANDLIYFVNPKRNSHKSSIYVDGFSGSDSNDGLHPTRAFKTINKAFSVMQGPSILPNISNGAWRLKIAAGVYNESAAWVADAPVKTFFEVEGELNGEGIPAVIIDGDGVTANGGLYFQQGPSQIKVSNITSKNFTSGSVSSGFVFDGRGIRRAWVENCRGHGNWWSGVNADSIGQFSVTGGEYTGNTAYQIRVRGGVGISIGAYSQNNRILVGECAGPAIQIRDACTGHVDYVDIVDAATGLHVTNVSRVTLVGAGFLRCNIGWNAGACSTVAHDTTTTFDDVSLNFNLTQNAVFGQDGSTNEGGEGLEYTPFFDRYTTGKRKWSTSTNPSPAAGHAWATGRTGVVDFNYLVPSGSSIRLSGGDDTDAVKQYLHFDLPNNRMRSVIGNQVCWTATSSLLAPGGDDSANLGHASLRWSQVYAASGTINTSDGRSKQQIKPIDEAALRAWARVEYAQYKFNDAVDKKGEGARWHFGLIAQRVKEAFEAEGLDAFEYGLLCYDEWEEVPEVPEQVDEDGNVVAEAIPYQPAGSRYGIRYEEALALECAYLRSRLS